LNYSYGLIDLDCKVGKGTKILITTHRFYTQKALKEGLFKHFLTDGRPDWLPNELFNYLTGQRGTVRAVATHRI
jgi:hypothetical protein